ncbi:MAG: PilN domain-containing protein [Phycisphaerae bacterium]
MTEIDFLPRWYRSRMRLRHERRRVAVWLSLMLATMGSWTAWQYGRVRRAEARLAQLDEGQARQAPLVARAAALREELSRLRARQALYGVVGGGVRLHDVLCELAYRQPDGVVLNMLRIDRGDRLAARADGGVVPRGDDGNDRASPALNVLLRGYGQRHADVGRYVTSLADSGVFVDVRPAYSRPANVSGRSVRAFEVRCRLPQFE